MPTRGQVHRAVVVLSLKPGTKDSGENGLSPAYRGCLTCRTPADAEAKVSAIVAQHRGIGVLNGLQVAGVGDERRLCTVLLFDVAAWR